MDADTLDPEAIISPRITALILDSPRLRRLLFPEGIITSPYRVLDYHQTLILRDKKGTKAVFRRVQRIQFQQDGVGAILDHFWGDGVALASYTNTAGALKDSFRDAGRRHLLIELPCPMAKGEILEFTTERIALEAFLDDEEWEETTIDHPILRLHRAIIFPKHRPCLEARLVWSGHETPLHVLEAEEGRTELRLHIPKARANTPYTIRWRW